MVRYNSIGIYPDDKELMLKYIIDLEKAAGKKIGFAKFQAILLVVYLKHKAEVETHERNNRKNRKS